MDTHIRRKLFYCFGLATACGLVAVASAAPTPALTYKTMEGVSLTYDGDLVAGTMTVNDVYEHTFQVDREDMAQHQEVGVFEGVATFSMTIELVSYVDGVATFTGSGPGPHLLATDENGEWMQADVVTMELHELPPPGFTFEGTGTLENVVCSGPEFQNVCTTKLSELGTLFVLRTGADVSLEYYLASGGMGGDPLRVHELEVHFSGDACWGDLDLDGDTDQSDLGILLASYNIDDGGDLNCDGLTDQCDLGILLADYECGL